MPSQLCKFTFPNRTNREVIEEVVAEALFAAECIHGTSKVRLGSGYFISDGRSVCVIDTSTQVGEHVAQVFTGLISRKLGEDSFRVERIEKGS